MKDDTMTSTHTVPDPVRWSEGMLLSPQHLQQDRLYGQARLQRLLDGAMPHRWGVRTLELDQAALVGGSASLTALECVLPDGTLVQYPGNGGMHGLSTDVGALCQAGGAPVRLYLAVPRLARYAGAAHSDEHDEAGGDADGVAVERMRLRCELKAFAAGRALPSDQCLCPLFEVERDAGGGMRLRNYHPPLLRLAGAAFLGERGLAQVAGALTLKLWRKIDELANAADEAPAPDDLLSGAGSAQLQAARTLAAGLPLLDLSVNEPTLHPHELYRLLAGVVGHLAALGGHPLPLKLQRYRHDDCMPQFVHVCRYIESRIAGLHAEYERHRFTPFKKGFSRRLYEDMHDDVIIELKPQAGQTLADMAHWLKAANIASAEMLPTVQAQRQSGATVHQLAAADARKLRLPVDAALFMLKNARILSKQANAYQAGSPLMIQGGRREHMPAQIFLYRRKRTEGGAPPAPAVAHADLPADFDTEAGNV
jgi:type VI secretion system protein ImpJ